MGAEVGGLSALGGVAFDGGFGDSLAELFVSEAFGAGRGSGSKEITTKEIAGNGRLAIARHAGP